MQFVSQPNLPKNAAAVIVSPLCSKESIKTIKSMGISVFYGFESKQPVQAINGHPDTNIIHMCDNVFVCAPAAYDYYYEMLSDYGVELIRGEKSGEGRYPMDVAYNAAIVGKFMIHNFEFTDKKLLDFGYIPINVKQGYSKCSVCVVADSAIITDDESIATATEKHGIDTLRVEKGDVRLGNLNYGFIGGACGKISRDILAVNGNLMSHGCHAKIIEFAEKFGVRCVSLSHENIDDIGSILPIIER